MSGVLARGLFGLLALGAVLMLPEAASAQIRLVPAYGESALVGPATARGVVVWNHGRSIHSEDSEAPTPLYLGLFRAAGWDVFRLDRMRRDDTLSNSSRALADHAEALRRSGYRRVALAGQSFGAFLSLLAAGRSDAVDAVIGTAPAAYGNFSDAYDSFRDNATRLWPILDGVRGARVMLFFFHHDDFDPGGRAEPARRLLAARGIDHLVIDQPAGLTGHGAAATGLFVRRFGACIVRFAEAPPAPTDGPCDAAWGRSPSPDLLQVGVPAVDAAGSEHPSPFAAPPAELRPFIGTWYGVYLNGREVVLSVPPTADVRPEIRADYLLGPGVVADQGLERVRRVGRLEEDELVFDEAGRNTLRYRLRPDGQLTGLWIERGGKSRLETVLHRVD